jgi:phosphoserine phosphatase
LVLVSGSFAPVVEPIAAAVGAQAVLCTELRSDGQCYTGEVVVPLLGFHKRAAVCGLLARHPHCDPLRCYAYGDHASDIPMLDSVGHPVAVGNDPALRAWMAGRS